MNGTEYPNLKNITDEHKDAIIYQFCNGSVFDTNPDTILKNGKLILDKISKLTSSHWKWCSDYRNIENGAIIFDVKDYFYFYFDSPDDAMLVRLSIDGLVRYQNADSRGLS